MDIRDLAIAKKKNNYKKDATAGGLWATTQIYKAVVPAGKRWILLSGFVYRAVSSTVEVTTRDVSDDIIGYLDFASAATGNTGYPDSTFAGNGQIVLDAGEYVQIQFGVAQDANSKASCVVLEIDI